MKKIFILFFLIIFFAACEGFNSADIERIRELELEIAYYQSHVMFMSEAVDSLQSPRIFSHGLNEDEVRKSFMNFYHGVNCDFAQSLESFFGAPFHYLDAYYAEILVDEKYVLVRGGFFDDFLDGLNLFFSYKVDEENEILWNFIGYDIAWLPNRFTLYREPATPRHITNEPEVTVRFYVCDSANKYFEGNFHAHDYLDGIFYVDEIISGENFWQEAISLIITHGGDKVYDFWYEGETLYVDLSASIAFGLGPMCDHVPYSLKMNETLLGFPNASSIVYLLDGREMPEIYDAFSTNTLHELFSRSSWGAGQSPTN